MSVNITDLAFEEGKDIIVRMWTSASTTWDFTGITDIDFSHPAGVVLVYPNEPGSTARVFVPYTAIQQIAQEI